MDTKASFQEKDCIMRRIYNFSAGPSTLPLPALLETAAELPDYRDSGMSLVEMSHRGKHYTAIHREAADRVKSLLDLSDRYTVLFLGGGATLQFAMVPLNLLGPEQSCDFTLTGAWAAKAAQDAARVGRVRVAYDGRPGRYTAMPKPAELDLDPQAAYLHLTSNETIGGIQWQTWPDTGSVPIVADMSSDIMSRPLPRDKFGLIYAGAQKNLGPAGLALAIVRDDVLARCSTRLPAYLGYRTHAESDGLYNTPPVFCVYMLCKTLRWLEEQGGVAAAAKRAAERAALVYDAIDRSAGFYRCPVDPACRSRMNIVWRLPDEELESRFLAEAATREMSGLKGHRSVGGCRASLYNAMPVAGARALADFMREFAARHRKEQA
jgi:phosphoserine aminotransferase